MQIAPALIDLCGADGFAIGGGTALAARWGHRTSTDIDIILDAEVFSRARDGLHEALNRTRILRLESGLGWMSGFFPEGDFGIATTPPLLSPACRIPRAGLGYPP